MSSRELVFRVGGAAGDGVASTAESFAKICTRSGLWTWTYSSYQSVIRGGHVWTQVRGGLERLVQPLERPVHRRAGARLDVDRPGDRLLALQPLPARPRVEEGTRVTIRYDISEVRGFGKLVLSLLAGSVKRQHEGDLRRVKGLLEARAL